MSSQFRRVRKSHVVYGVLPPATRRSRRSSIQDEEGDDENDVLCNSELSWRPFLCYRGSGTWHVALIFGSRTCIQEHLTAGRTLFALMGLHCTTTEQDHGNPCASTSTLELNTQDVIVIERSVLSKRRPQDRRGTTQDDRSLEHRVSRCELAQRAVAIVQWCWTPRALMRCGITLSTPCPRCEVHSKPQ